MNEIIDEKDDELHTISCGSASALLWTDGNRLIFQASDNYEVQFEGIEAIKDLQRLIDYVLKTYGSNP